MCQPIHAYTYSLIYHLFDSSFDNTYTHPLIHANKHHFTPHHSPFPISISYLAMSPNPLTSLLLNYRWIGWNGPVIWWKIIRYVTCRQNLSIPHWACIINHHHSIRCSFHLMDGGMWQGWRIWEQVGVMQFWLLKRTWINVNHDCVYYLLCTNLSSTAHDMSMFRLCITWLIRLGLQCSALY